LQELQTALPTGSILRQRYVIERIIGKGGFGSVYLVHDVRAKGNRYALKEIVQPDKKDRERFLFEGELLKRVDHPSLPRVYRVFEDDARQRSYMLMDYIDGPNLEALRQQQLGRRMPLPAVLALLKPMVDALTYLHHLQPPVLHRDIKPSNILVPESGEDAVLVDFGIAKEYEPDGTTTALRTGSPGYAAPEQYSTGTSVRSDVYGLGATLYTLLTGCVPADALYRMTHMGGGQGDPLEPLNKLNPNIPPEVAAAIHRALSLNSNDRYPSVEAFWQDLQAQPGWEPLDTPPLVPAAAPSVKPQPSTPKEDMDTLKLPAARVQAVPVSQSQVLTQKRTGRPLRRILLLLLLFLLVGSGAGMFWKFTSSHQQARSAPPSTATATAVTLSGMPTATPTQAKTPSPVARQSQPTPTVPPVSQPTSHPTVRPTPYPTKTPDPPPLPTPTPVPKPSPTPVPYPNVAGNYSGTIDDTTANITTGMSLSISQAAGQGNISGYFTVNPPLTGNGKFSGTISTGKYIQFIVQAYQNNRPLYFWGWVQSDGSIQGDYCSLNTQNKCDLNAGASGIWNVAKAP